jgi:hypothetical protein
MAENENINQEPSSEDIPKEIISEETTATETAAPETQTELLEQQSESSEMEVHHHGHIHSTSKWKEYFFQFFMLFLAVFCGFLAEYQLEHKIERDREKQYVESMILDMQEDTAKMAIAIPENTQKLAALDSLLATIYSRPYNDSSLRMMYYLVRRYTGSRINVDFTKRTITQLKNSGGLRLIRNMAVSDSIILYNESCERLEQQGDAVFMYQNEARAIGTTIFDLEYVLKYNRYTIHEFLSSDVKPLLLHDDEKRMKEYANKLYYLRAVLHFYIDMLNVHQALAKSNIRFLQKEYHLE